MKILYFTILICLVGLIIWLLARTRGANDVASQESTTEPRPAQTYVDLRTAALEVHPEKIGLSVQHLGEAPYGVLMEMRSGANTATLVSFADGSTSLYYSTGGGVIGGHAHETVRQATQAFVNTSANHLSILTKTDEFPMPRPNRIRFYVLTCSGVFTAEEEERELVDGHSPLSSLFYAGNEVITQFRLATEDPKAP